MTTFTITRARDMDGTPYEVAERAVRQVEGLFRLSEEALADANLAARNSQMSRNLLLDPSDAGGDAWDQNVVAKKLARIEEDLQRALGQLSHIRLAAGFDPKNPPKE